MRGRMSFGGLQAMIPALLLHRERALANYFPSQLQFPYLQDGGSAPPPGVAMRTAWNQERTTTLQTTHKGSLGSISLSFPGLPLVGRGE